MRIYRTARIAASIAVAFLMTATTHSATTTDTTPLIPRVKLFGNPKQAAPQLSPDGRYMAYLKPANGVLNVFVKATTGGDEHQVTTDTVRPLRGFMWQPDSRHILYSQDTGGDEDFNVFQASVETTRIVNLTPFSGVQARIEAVDPLVNDYILVSLNKRDKKVHDVYRLSLTTGGLEMIQQNPGNVADWGVDNALQVRTAEILQPDGSTLVRIRDGGSGEFRDFTSWSAEETFGGVAGFSPANTKLWLMTSVGANAARLLEVDIATSKTKVIAEHPMFDVSGVVTHPSKRTIQAVTFEGQRQIWKTIDPNIGKDFDALRKVADGDFSIQSRDLADTKWIVVFNSDNKPIRYFLYDRKTRKAEFLFTTRPELLPYTLAKMEPISFKARDGMTLYGYLTLPVGRPAKNLPLILDVHGGPWSRDGWGYDNEVQWLANRGYAVLQINFRGSTGYGKKYLNAGNREWGAKMHDDIIDGKRWAVKRGIADPDKVVIKGGSYGGYAALVGATFTPEEFAAAISVVGPSSIVTLIRSIPPYWEPAKAQFRMRVGDVETEEEFLKSRSPLYRADKITIPLFVAQGANDPRVKQAESDQIVAAARKNGKKVTYLVFPDEGHGFAKPQNRLKYFAAVEQFLAEILGGRSEPPNGTENWDGLLK